jgi:hypothetical protein
VDGDDGARERARNRPGRGPSCSCVKPAWARR